MGRWDLCAQGVSLLSVDLPDQRCYAEVFGQMPDVTHLVYAAVNETPGLIQGWRDREQMATNLVQFQHTSWGYQGRGPIHRTHPRA